MDYGLWAKPGVPHKGWVCADVEDLGEPDATCEMCERMTIRYVHHMTHADHAPLAVGCVCAGHMEGDLAAAKGRETALVKKVRFSQSSRNWKRVTGKPISHGHFKGGLFMQVEALGSKWMLTVLDRKGAQIHRSYWPTELRAKLRAYEGLQKIIARSP